MKKKDERTPAEGSEPQSYGSQADWVEGKTGQTVNETPGHISSRHEAFYESRHDSDRSKTGGKRSPESQKDDDYQLPDKK